MRNHSDQRLTKFRETISLLCQAYFFALVSIKGYRICGFLWESKASRYLQISYGSCERSEQDMNIPFFLNSRNGMEKRMSVPFCSLRFFVLWISEKRLLLIFCSCLETGKRRR